jgi:short-chain fatty acids transporter
MMPAVALASAHAHGVDKRRTLETAALTTTAWMERWYPDTFSIAVLALALVSTAALVAGATPRAVAIAFGDGLWSLMPFTMQKVFVVISGHVVARARPTAWLIRAMARVPRTGRGAIVYVALASLVASLLSWALSLILSELSRTDLGELVTPQPRARRVYMQRVALGASLH